MVEIRKPKPIAMIKAKATQGLFQRAGIFSLARVGAGESGAGLIFFFFLAIREMTEFSLKQIEGRVKRIWVRLEANGEQMAGPERKRLVPGSWFRVLRFLDHSAEKTNDVTTDPEEDP